jgi:hypothetical protein
VVLESGQHREVVEIKLTSGPTPEDLVRLARVADMLDATRHTLICRIRQSVFTPVRIVANLPDYLNPDRDW